MRRAFVALALCMLSLPVSASFVEDTLAPIGVTYQEDAGVHGDAPATCLEAQADRGVTFAGADSAGMLVEEDDEQDAYVLSLNETVVGERVSVSMLTGILTDRYDVAFDVLSPDCLSSVFDADSAYYDPAPATPYEPPVGSTTYEATLTGYACNADQWKFLGNQMGGIPAPATIYVEWSNGEWEYVPVVKSTPATIAMYTTSSNLDVTVERAVIVLPAWYTGQFKLAHGPCDAVEGEPEPDPYVDSELNTRYGEFTVQETGPHVIIVTITRSTVDKTTDTVTDLANDPPSNMATTCHDICTAALQFTSFDLGSNFAS